MDITPISGPCLLEHSPDTGLAPSRTICTDLRSALALAVQTVEFGPPEVWPDEWPRESVKITCARADGSLPDPDLWVSGPTPHVYKQLLTWAADASVPDLVAALTGETNPSANDLRAAVADPIRLAAALRATHGHTWTEQQ